MAQQIVHTLTQASVEHVSTEYTRLLLLLGKDAVDPLDLAVHTSDLPEHVRLELIGLLGNLAEDEQVAEYVNTLTAGANGKANFLHRALGLRALGGLLAGGVYNEKKLEEIRKSFSTSSKPQDRAAFEFFDVLLGQRNLPELIRLRERVNRQQDEIDRLNKLICQQDEKLTRTHQRAEQAKTRIMSFLKWLNKR